MSAQAAPEAQKNLIEIANVNKYYGTNHVLKNINLSVGKGEVVVLLGPPVPANPPSAEPSTASKLSPADPSPLTDKNYPKKARTRQAPRRSRHGFPVLQPLRAQEHPR